MTKCRSTRPGRIARDGLAETDQLDGLDVKRSLLADFADDGLFQRFAELDPAAGQRVDAFGRRPRAPHDQHLAVAEDRGARPPDKAAWDKSAVGRLRH